MGDSLFSKHNGKSGFVSFDESSTLKSATTKKRTKTTVEVHETVDYSDQNWTNQKLARKINGSDHTGRLEAECSDESSLPPPDDGHEYVFRHGRWWPKEAARVVDYYWSFGDWFNKFPKTDYLYSPSSPWYGTEVAPGIPRIPNMCRPSYRNYREDNTFRRGRVLFESASAAHRETWTQLFRRWVRTTVTTVETVATTTTRFVSSAFVAVASRLPSSSFADREGMSSKAWLLLFLLLLVPLFCYPAYQSGALNSQNMSAHISNLCQSVSPLLKPYFAMWDGLKHFTNLLVQAILLIPSFLGEVGAALYGLFYSSNETDFVPAVAPKSPVMVGTKISEKEQSCSSPSPQQMEVLDRTAELLAAIKLLTSRVDGLDRNSREELMKTEKFDRKISELEAAIKSFSSRADECERNSKEDLIRRDVFDNKMSDVEAAIKSLSSKATENEAKISSVAATAKIAGPRPDVDLTDFVQKMIDIYHADRTGKTDYALASTGGSIASIRCTRPFDKRPRQYDFWGIIFWDQINLPDVILKTGHLPGECWAFEGANGYVVIRLSAPIFITGFSLEHTPKVLTPHGHIKSAPRKFSVWGLETLDDKDEELLGRFEFLDNGKSLQMFDAIAINKPFQLVELRIESNHGHLEYTCLYRFRVHGQAVDEPTEPFIR